MSETLTANVIISHATLFKLTALFWNVSNIVMTLNFTSIQRMSGDVAEFEQSSARAAVALETWPMYQNDLDVRRRAREASYDDWDTAPVDKLKKDLKRDDRQMRIIRRIERLQEQLDRT